MIRKLAVSLHKDFLGLALTVIAAVLVGSLPLAEFLFGREILSIDMTFYWDVARRSFFETGSYWWDQCNNGYSLAQNPLYGIFSILNWPFFIFENFTARRIEFLSFHMLFAFSSYLWLRSLKFESIATAIAILIFCGSSLTAELVWRNKPYLFPMIFVPVCGFFAGKSLTEQSFLRSPIWGFFAGVAAGAGFLAGDVLAPAYCALAAVATQWAIYHQTKTHKNAWLMCITYLAGVTGLLLTMSFTIQEILEVTKTSTRSGGLTPGETLTFSFHPIRILEFLYPFFGDSGHPGFTGGKYTSSMVPGVWWYSRVTFGVVGCALSIAGLVFAAKSRPLRGFFLCIGFLVFVSFGMWNPIVEWFVVHSAALRMFRYPAKAILPAAVLMMPIVANAIGVFKLFLISRFRDKRMAGFAFFAIAAIGILNPALSSPLFEVSSIHPDNTPPLLRDLQPAPARDNRVIAYSGDIPSTKLSLEHIAVMESTPMYWRLNGVGCPEATISYSHLVGPFEGMGALSRERLGISHILTSKQYFELAQSKSLAEGLTISGRSGTDDVILLSANMPPNRFSVVSKWKMFSPPISYETQGMSSGNTYVSSDFFLDQSGTLQPGSNAEPSISEPGDVESEVCQQTVDGIYDSVVAAGSFKVNTKCPGLFVLNSRFTAGWRATVDGRPVRILRASMHMLGVEVPQGQSLIDIKYAPGFRPIWVKTSIFLQSALLMVLASLGILIPLRS